MRGFTTDDRYQIPLYWTSSKTMNTPKHGSFDWLVESREFIRFLGPKFTGVIGEAKGTLIEIDD